MVGESDLMFFLDKKGVAVLGKYLFDIDDMSPLCEIDEGLFIILYLLDDSEFLYCLVVDHPCKPYIPCLFVSRVE
jgi:hypothetical protein